MELKKYQKLVENEYGLVSIPSSDENIKEIIDMVFISLRGVSLDDYYLLQAIMILNEWSIENGILEEEYVPIDY